jgi:hypothetical protein
MKDSRSRKVHALEFGCQAPLNFYHHCSSCPRFGDECPDLKLGTEILRGRKELIYTTEAPIAGVHASSFKCLAPLHYFEKTRTNCAHAGHCREEGLLLALLTGKRQLDYAAATVVEIPSRKPSRVPAAAEELAKKSVA